MNVSDLCRGFVTLRRGKQVSGCLPLGLGFFPGKCDTGREGYLQSES